MHFYVCFMIYDNERLLSLSNKFLYIRTFAFRHHIYILHYIPLMVVILGGSHSHNRSCWFSSWMKVMNVEVFEVNELSHLKLFEIECLIITMLISILVLCD